MMRKSKGLTNEQAAGCVAGLFMLFIWVPLNVLMQGWVGKVLWNWFLEPLGLPHIGLFEAAGVMIAAAFFVVPSAYLALINSNTKGTTTFLEESINTVLLNTTFAAYALILGFLVHLFV